MNAFLAISLGFILSIKRLIDGVVNGVVWLNVSTARARIFMSYPCTLSFRCGVKVLMLQNSSVRDFSIRVVHYSIALVIIHMGEMLMFKPQAPIGKITELKIKVGINWAGENYLPSLATPIFAFE